MRLSVKNLIFLLVLIFSLLFILSSCTQEINSNDNSDDNLNNNNNSNISDITSFEECVAAGNPIMESYPRQCIAGGQTFVENVAIYNECSETEKENSACTKEYVPVCGIVDNGIRCITEPCESTDAISYGNDCTACADQSYGYYAGSCEGQIFVVCQETVTGFDPEEYANAVGGICVDICPANFDSFTTQTGIEVCISHYGEEEIANWEICAESTESCNCIKASETTSGEIVEDSEFRCVPDLYANRLLFTSGQDRLDENGDESVMIS